MGEAGSADARDAFARAGEALRAELALPEDGALRLAAALAELVAAVPAAGRLVPWGAGAALELLRLAVRAHLQPARAAFLAEVREVTAGLAAMLGAGRGGDGDAAAVGSMGGRFLDPARLAGLTRAAAQRDRRSTTNGAAGWRRRARFSTASSPPAPRRSRRSSTGSEAPGTLPPAADGWQVTASDDAVRHRRRDLRRRRRRARARCCGRCAAPASSSPATTCRSATVRCSSGSTGAPSRPPRWRCSRPVAVVASGDHAANGGLRPLSRLLLSGRPVQAMVVVVPAGQPRRGRRGDRLPLRAGLARRRPARGVRAAELAGAPGAPRRRPGPRPVFWARLSPRAGHATGRGRGRVFGPDRSVAVGRCSAGGARPPAVPLRPGGGAGLGRAASTSRATRSRPPTGRAAAGGGTRGRRRDDPRPAVHLRRLRAARPGCGTRSCARCRPVSEHADLVPIGDWLALEPSDAGHRVPWIWAVDGGGTLHRLAVGRRLARACRDRLGYWRTLQEMAGVRSEYADRAADAARREAEEAAARRARPARGGARRRARARARSAPPPRWSTT